MRSLQLLPCRCVLSRGSGWCSGVKVSLSINLLVHIMQGEGAACRYKGKLLVHDRITNLMDPG